MNKIVANQLQSDCIAALQAVAEKHGFTVRAHGGTLAEISAVLKFEFKTADQNAIRENERCDFEIGAVVFGLEPSDYRREFIANGKPFKVVAFDYKRRKYPIIAEKADGTRTCFTETVVKAIVAARKPS